MELEDKEKRELWEEQYAAGLRDAANERTMESARAAEPDRWKKVAPLMLSTLVLAVGIVVFRWMGWHFVVASGSACRYGTEAYYSICYSPFGWFLLGPALFFGAVIAAGIEGIRGRGYRRWLLLATVLVVVPIAAKFLELLAVVSGR